MLLNNNIFLIEKESPHQITSLKTKQLRLSKCYILIENRFLHLTHEEEIQLHCVKICGGKSKQEHVLSKTTFKNMPLDIRKMGSNTRCLLSLCPRRDFSALFNKCVIKLSYSESSIQSLCVLFLQFLDF